MTRIYKEVEVEFDLADIDTEDLLQELEDRQERESPIGVYDKDLMKIYELRILKQDYERELDEFIFNHLGRF